MGIASHFINVAFPVISQSPCSNFKSSINTEKLPDSWKTARVAPIFKSGGRDDRSNYRPISVLPAVSRLFEKLVYDQLYNHLDRNNHLYMHQLSFQALHSVVTYFLKTTHDWYVNIDNSKVNAVIFIDLKKAFDTVDHDILLAKMLYYGIKGIEPDWFRSNLNNRKQFCNVNGVSSEIQTIDIGVPQGSCL